MMLLSQPSTARRGAARVNAIWLIALLVGILVAAAMAFVGFDEAAQNLEGTNKAKADLAEAESRLEAAVDNYRGVSGIAGFYDETSAVKESNPEAMTTGLEALRSAFPDMDPQVVTTFEKAADVAAKGYAKAKSQIQALENQITDLRAQVAAKDSEMRDLAREKDKEIASLQSQKQDLEQAAEERESDLASQVDTLRGSLRETDTELRGARNTLEEEKRGFEQEVGKLVSSLQNKNRKLDHLNAPAAPDGEVLAVSPGLGLGWINLGTQHRLTRGMRFHVMDGLPGSNRQKAWAEVIDVELRRAQIRITDQADPFLPVVAGDVIANPVYDPKGERDAVLVGRFSGAYNAKELGILLKEIGINVQKDVDARTDYMIVGSEVYVDEDGEALEEPMQPADMPIYKEAVARGVAVVPLKKLREFIPN